MSLFSFKLNASTRCTVCLSHSKD